MGTTSKVKRGSDKLDSSPGHQTNAGKKPWVGREEF